MSQRIKHMKLHCLTCDWVGDGNECKYVKEFGTYEGYPLVASCPECNHIKIDIARHPDGNIILKTKKEKIMTKKEFIQQHVLNHAMNNVITSLGDMSKVIREGEQVWNMMEAVMISYDYYEE